MKSSSSGFYPLYVRRHLSTVSTRAPCRMVHHLVEDGTLHALTFAPIILLEYRISTRDPDHNSHLLNC